VVDVCNKLPEEVVSCNSVTCFKVKLDQLFKDDISPLAFFPFCYCVQYTVAITLNTVVFGTPYFQKIAAFVQKGCEPLKHIL